MSSLKDYQTALEKINADMSKAINEVKKKDDVFTQKHNNLLKILENVKSGNGYQDNKDYSKDIDTMNKKSEKYISEYKNRYNHSDAKPPSEKNNNNISNDMKPMSGLDFINLIHNLRKELNQNQNKFTDFKNLNDKLLSLSAKTNYKATSISRQDYNSYLEVSQQVKDVLNKSVASPQSQQQKQPYEKVELKNENAPPASEAKDNTVAQPATQENTQPAQVQNNQQQQQRPRQMLTPAQIDQAKKNLEGTVTQLNSYINIFNGFNKIKESPEFKYFAEQNITGKNNNAETKVPLYKAMQYSAYSTPELQQFGRIYEKLLNWNNNNEDLNTITKARDAASAAVTAMNENAGVSPLDLTAYQNYLLMLRNFQPKLVQQQLLFEQLSSIKQQANKPIKLMTKIGNNIYWNAQGNSQEFSYETFNQVMPTAKKNLSVILNAVQVLMNQMQQPQTTTNQGEQPIPTTQPQQPSQPQTIDTNTANQNNLG